MPGIRLKDKDAHEADEIKTRYSDVVVFGKASSIVTGTSSEIFPLETYDGMYTVSFEIICTFKGHGIPYTIYIAGMGE